MTSPGQRDSQNGRACQLRAVIQMQDYDEISKGEISPGLYSTLGQGPAEKMPVASLRILQLKGRPRRLGYLMEQRSSLKYAVPGGSTQSP